MRPEELVQVWKDPEGRSNRADHPAGEISLDAVGGDEAAAILSTVLSGCEPTRTLSSECVLLCFPTMDVNCL
jgi:hypothetical protein